MEYLTETCRQCIVTPMSITRHRKQHYVTLNPDTIATLRQMSAVIFGRPNLSAILDLAAAEYIRRHLKRPVIDRRVGRVDRDDSTMPTHPPTPSTRADEVNGEGTLIPHPDSPKS